MTTDTVQNVINHIVLVVDKSSSMGPLTSTVIKVADNQIKHLARRSQEMGQETRVSVYTFGTEVECVVWDKDVLRLPSIANFYRPYGWTALIDATAQAIEDLQETPTKYGDHAFLMFVLTDGEENRSQRKAPALTRLINDLPDNWTVAVMVPDQSGVFEAKRFGFPAANIAVWDASTQRGMEEAGEVIRRVTDNYMTARSTGTFRGSKSIFSTGADAVNADTIQQAGLKPLTASKYKLVPVPRDVDIRPFVEECGYKYKIGSCYYQLTKRVKIQATKNIAIVEKKGKGRVFTGANARQLVGLPDELVSVKPDHNPDFDIYVESNSVNRRLFAGTRLLILS